MENGTKGGCASSASAIGFRPTGIVKTLPWMFRNDGLGLSIGSESQSLMAYAVIYGQTAGDPSLGLSLSAQELAGYLGTSVEKAKADVSELIALGLVHEVKVGEFEAGRRTTLVIDARRAEGAQSACKGMTRQAIQGASLTSRMAVMS